MRADVPDDFVYTPPRGCARAGSTIGDGARPPRLVAANRLVIYAGQGVHYARAWKQLRELAELLEAPVTDEPAGQERVPGEPPAVARARVGARSASSSTTS
jgi:acetolactate synthase-1/2/3 large subunit